MHNLVNFEASEATMVPRALSHGLFQKPTVQKIVLAWCNGQEQLCKSQSTMQIGANLKAAAKEHTQREGVRRPLIPQYLPHPSVVSHSLCSARSMYHENSELPVGMRMHGVPYVSDHPPMRRFASPRRQGDN